MKHRKKRRGGRRTRRNASFAASFSPAGIVSPALNLNRWKGVGAQILGLSATTALSTMLNSRVGFLQGDGLVKKAARLFGRLAVGGVVATVAKKVRPGMYDDVLNGALLSAASQFLQEVAPQYFKGLGEGEDWFDYGMSGGMNDFADPRQMANPYSLGDFADPRQMANPYALGDFADPRQMANPYAMSGSYQDSVVAEQLAEEMM